MDHALGTDEIIIGALMLTEVLQAFRKEADVHKVREFMCHFPIVAMLGSNMVIKRAENYHRLR